MVPAVRCWSVQFSKKIFLAKKISVQVAYDAQKLASGLVQKVGVIKKRRHFILKVGEISTFLNLYPSAGLAQNRLALEENQMSK